MERMHKETSSRYAYLNIRTTSVQGLEYIGKLCPQPSKKWVPSRLLCTYVWLLGLLLIPPICRNFSIFRTFLFLLFRCSIHTAADVNSKNECRKLYLLRAVSFSDSKRSIERTNVMVKVSYLWISKCTVTIHSEKMESEPHTYIPTEAESFSVFRVGIGAQYTSDKVHC